MKTRKPAAQTAHTPGPWQAVDHNGATQIWPSDQRLSKIALLLGDREPKAANARLIAASPDLLAACKEARTLLEMNNARRDMMTDRERALWNTLRAAIAKAEGREGGK